MKKDYSKDVFKQLQEAMEMIAQMQEELREARVVIAQQAKRIAELEEKVGKNSGNSSKPPSSDFFKKPTNGRKKSGRKSGGQKGHKPYNAELYEEPDEIIEHKVEKCECGGEIKHLREYKAKQLVDIGI